MVESTVAQVGKSKPVVPSSQVLDNEVWETWMAPFDDQSDALDISGQPEEIYSASISPGISTAPVLRPKRITPISSPSHKLLPGQHPKSSWNSYDSTSQNGSSPPPSPTAKLPAESETQPQATFRHGRHADEVCIRAAQTAVPQQILRQEMIVDPNRFPSKTEKEVDPDESWKKFVFGESSDEADVEKYVMSAHRVRPRTIAASSMVGNVSTRISPQSRSMPRFSESKSPSSKASRAQVFAHDNGERNHSCSDETDVQSSRHEDEVSGQDDHASTYVLDGSLPTLQTSSSNLAHASMAALVSSQTEPPTVKERMKRVTFRRPEPFVGSKDNMDQSEEENEPLHIGRRRERDLYSLVGSEESVESIEDD